MTKRLLFVVHRYPPYPGGSENYVRAMAEEALSRGHQVWVYSDIHQGNLNGVNVSSDMALLLQPWDLIIVHAGDITHQDIVIKNAKIIDSPILFLIIQPSESDTYLEAIKSCRYLGCSTIADWDYVKKHHVEDKAVQVIHGIDEKCSIGQPGFKKKYGITTKQMFLSCGGFWPHKAMPELIEAFNEANLSDTTLVLTGYDTRFGQMPQETAFVKPFLVEDLKDVMSAMMEADLFILNSYKEGFGLVLLEAMLNKTPWAARNIAGAQLLKAFGFVYETKRELIEYMKNFRTDEKKVLAAYDYVRAHHLIKNTVDDILNL